MAERTPSPPMQPVARRHAQAATDARIDGVQGDLQVQLLAGGNRVGGHRQQAHP